MRNFLTILCVTLAIPGMALAAESSTGSMPAQKPAVQQSTAKPVTAKKRWPAKKKAATTKSTSAPAKTGSSY